MTARARITIHTYPYCRGSRKVTDQSVITVYDGGVQVAAGPVADDDGIPHRDIRRVTAGLASLGWAPTRYGDSTYVPDGWVDGAAEGFEIDVEPLS